MKYYSEILHKVFDSPEELEKEEHKELELQDKEYREFLEKELLKSMRASKEAQVNLEKVKDSFVELRKEFEKELEQLIKEPKETFEKAEKEKAKIAKQFKEKFGEDEYKKALSRLMKQPSKEEKVENKESQDKNDTIANDDWFYTLLDLFSL